jgi:hypothetical protein
MTPAPVIRRSDRRMPIQTFPPYDLGDLAGRERLTDEEQAQAERWRGWVVTYRSNTLMSSVAELRSGDRRRMVAALAVVVAGWNFVDEQGNELPQPTRETFTSFGLDDDLLVTLAYGYLEQLRAPKATTSG